MDFTKIAVLGPGLLGGSIALAWRARQPAVRLGIWARRDCALDEVRRAEIAAIISTDLGEVVAEAQLVILCMPIGAMAAVAEKIAPLLSAEAVVTDIGSVKSSVVAELAPIFKNGGFVGSHPMAGSEQTGFAAARADLFQNAMCLVTPAESDPVAVALVEKFWKILGCRVAALPPAEHDEIVARVSHLPHLLAAAIVNLAFERNPRALEFSGPGFRDTTRVASGPPAMWAEILLQNRGPVVDSINAMIEKLRALSKLLGTGDAQTLERFLIEARATRDTLKTNDS